MERSKILIANPIFMALSTFLSSIALALILRFGLDHNKTNLEHVIIPVAMIFFYLYVKTFKTGTKGMPKDFRIKYSTLTTILFLLFKAFEFYYLTNYSSMPVVSIFIKTTLIQVVLCYYSLYFISGKFVKRERNNSKKVVTE